MKDKNPNKNVFLKHQKQKQKNIPNQNVMIDLKMSLK